MPDFDSIPEPPVTPESTDAPEPPAAPEDASGAPAPEGAEPSESAAKEAWDGVVRSLDDLGHAVTSWAKSATNTAENRLKATQLKEQLEGVGRRIGDVVDSASKTDFAQHVGKAASGTGEVIMDAARKFGEDVGPHLAGAFRSAADSVMSVGRKRPEESEESGSEAPREEPPAPPAPPTDYIP